MIRAVTTIGLAVVAICAVAVSFAGLYGLALLCSFGPQLAALVPVLVDAGAGVATVVWLAGDVPDKARRYAQKLALGLLAVSVAGNAGSHALVAAGARPHWVVVVLVGALAPAVLAAVIHLSALVKAGGERVAEAGSAGPIAYREMTAEELAADEPDVDGQSFGDEVAEPLAGVAPRLALAGDQGFVVDVEDLDEDAGGEPDVLEKAREMAAAGVGRPTLVKELGLAEHVAREIVRKHKPRQEGSA